MKRLIFIVWILPVAIASERLLERVEARIGQPRVIHNEVTEDDRKKQLAQQEAARQKRAARRQLEAAPGARMFVDANGKRFANTLVTYELASDDTDVRITTFCLNEDCQKYEHPLTIKNDGTYQIRYWSEDHAGNRESEKEFAVTVDGTAPDITLEPAENLRLIDGKLYGKKGATVLLDARDSRAGLESLFVNINNRGFSKTNPGSISLEEGLNLIEAVAVDRLGNRSAPVSLSVIIDSSPPVLRLNGPPLVGGQKNICTGGASVSVSGQDEGSGIEILFIRKGPSAPWIRYRSPVPISGTEFRLEAMARDFSGNESPVSSFACRVDSDAPESKLEISQ